MAKASDSYPNLPPDFYEGGHGVVYMFYTVATHHGWCTFNIHTSPYTMLLPYRDTRGVDVHVNGLVWLVILQVEQFCEQQLCDCRYQ